MKYLSRVHRNTFKISEINLFCTRSTINNKGYTCLNDSTNNKESLPLLELAEEKNKNPPKIQNNTNHVLTKEERLVF